VDILCLWQYFYQLLLWPIFSDNTLRKNYMGNVSFLIFHCVCLCCPNLIVQFMMCFLQFFTRGVYFVLYTLDGSFNWMNKKPNIIHFFLLYELNLYKILTKYFHISCKIILEILLCWIVCVQKHSRVSTLSV